MFRKIVSHKFWETKMIRSGVVGATGLLLFAIFVPRLALASTTENGITVSSQQIFADNRGINDIGEAQGLVLQLGLDIQGGSAGYFGGGLFTPTGSATPSIVQTLTACAPSSVNSEQCLRSSTFTPAKLNGTWDFGVTSPTGTSATFALPSVTEISTTPVPFPFNVSITNSTNGINPTVSWTIPTGYTPNAFRINIFDRSTPPTANGVDNQIDSAIISPTATSYTIPTTLSSGQTLVVGDKYSISFQMITTRDGGSDPTNSNADILSRSTSFFDFTPKLGSTTPSNIQLPMVDGVTGVYHFNVGSVGPDSVTFIDPEVATGYIYNTGAGDPNFASVLLPDVGGGVFDVSYLSTSVMVDAGQQYFFGPDGVSQFTVSGIDPSAHLDPSDTSAFVTGLTFVTNGSFTGTMTPIITTGVPESSTWSMILLGFAGLGYASFRHKARLVAG
jgi:hypothetical protein